MSGAVFKAESECLGECGRGKSGFPLLVGNIALTVRSEHFSVQLRTEVMCRELRVSWCVRRSCSEGECPVPPAVTPGIPQNQAAQEERAILVGNILPLVKHLVCKS